MFNKVEIEYRNHSNSLHIYIGQFWSIWHYLAFKNKNFKEIRRKMTVLCQF